VSAQLNRRCVKTSRLLEADMAGWCDGKEVTIELNEAGPGTSGKHYHPGHSFTWVVEGSEVYAVAGTPSKTVNAGYILHEEPMQVHKVDNQSSGKLLVVRLVEKGKPATVQVP
jgi:quercetin dioxygenase-like cupin family protein